MTSNFKLPSAVHAALESMPELLAQNRAANTIELRDELQRELWRHVPAGSSEEQEQIILREDLQEWVLAELRTPVSNSRSELFRLQILLTTLYQAASSDSAAVEAVTDDIATPALLNALSTLLKSAENQVEIGRRYPNQEEIAAQTIAAGRDGIYSALGYFSRHEHVRISSDLHMAIMLLARFSPETLASIIEEKRNALFSLAVRQVLAEAVPKFALLTNDVTYKFICASPLGDMLVANAPTGIVPVIRDLLLQVANTSQWQAWLSGFIRYPQADSVAVAALSEALIVLTSTHWAGFIDSVELWNHAPTAPAVAQVLGPFLNSLGPEKTTEMWNLAFERWNQWNYGVNDEHKFLFSPEVCSFDFPVAMYYALLPLDETKLALEYLEREISIVEQKWFPDFSTLVTYRNRLSSRLRLVKHGLTIRNSAPGPADALPPPIEPDSEYGKYRFRYFDVHAR